MSKQFRLTVKQLFSSKLLFVAQATFHGGKRYSLNLIDFDNFPPSHFFSNNINFQLNKNNFFILNQKARKSAPEITEGESLQLQKRSVNYKQIVSKITRFSTFNK